jgi:hypothetical protein
MVSAWDCSVAHKSSDRFEAGRIVVKRIVKPPLTETAPAIDLFARHDVRSKSTKTIKFRVRI